MWFKLLRQYHTLIHWINLLLHALVLYYIQSIYAHHIVHAFACQTPRWHSRPHFQNFKCLYRCTSDNFDKQWWQSCATFAVCYWNKHWILERFNIFFACMCFAWSFIIAQRWFLCICAWVPRSLSKCVLWIYLGCSTVGDPWPGYCCPLGGYRTECAKQVCVLLVQ